MLSGSAVRELACILLEAVGVNPAPHVGHVRNRGDRYRAIRELEDSGLVQVERIPGKASRFAFRATNDIGYLSIYSGTVLEPTRMPYPLHGGRGNPLPVEENQDTRIPSHVEENLYTYDSPYDEATALDSMSDEGKDKPGLAGTPFRKRRLGQREFVQRMWAELYPHLPPLIDANANEFLRICDESAELVYEVFEKLQTNPKASFAYIRGAARKEKEKREATSPEGTTSPATGSVLYPGWESDEAYYAHQEKVKEIQQWMSENGISDDD
jgi:hypothetical protein